MFCPNCGNEIKAGNAFCASCGTQVGGTSATPERTVNTYGGAATASDSNTKRYIAIGLAVVMAIVLVLGFLSFRDIKGKWKVISIGGESIEEYVGYDIEGVYEFNGEKARRFVNGEEIAEIEYEKEGDILYTKTGRDPLYTSWNGINLVIEYEPDSDEAEECVRIWTFGFTIKIVILSAVFVGLGIALLSVLRSKKETGYTPNVTNTFADYNYGNANATADVPGTSDLVNALNTEKGSETDAITETNNSHDSAGDL